MSKKRKNLAEMFPDGDMDGDGIPNKDDTDHHVVVPEVKIPKPKKNFWKETAFGRTLTLRNKLGKVIAVTAVGSIPVVGDHLVPFLNIVNETSTMEPIIDILFSTEALTGLVSAIIFAGVTLGYLSSKLGGLIKEFTVTLIEAKSATSDGGKRITKKELLEIIDKLIALIEQIASRFMIKIDLNQDGKIGADPKKE